MKCKILQNSKQQVMEKRGETDYSIYEFSMKEYIRYSIEGMGILVLISYLFYEKLWVILILMPSIYPYLKHKKKVLCEKRKRELKIEFRDMCISMSSSMSTGNSISNSIISAYREMKEMYGEKSDITRELSLMLKSLKMNIPVEDIFEKFADRSDIEEIRTFSEILNIAQRGGGDMIKIMKTTADGIGEKIDVEREIQSIINSKKYEQMIMNLVPFIIILYMKLTSPETLEVMYQTICGTVIMSICLFVYCVAYAAGKRMTRIEV